MMVGAEGRPSPIHRRLTRTRLLRDALVVTCLTSMLLVGAPHAAADPVDPPAPSESTDPPLPSDAPPPGPSDPPPPSEPPPPVPSDSPSPTGAPPPSEPPAPEPSDPPSPGEPPTQEPPPFSEEIDAARPGQELLAAEATRLSRLVLQTEERLDQLEVQALAAADIYRAAEADLARANTRAEQAREAAARAEENLRRARDDLVEAARGAYINGDGDSLLAGALLLLDSTSPADLIERAGLLEAAAASRSEIFERVVAAQVRTAATAEAASQAVDSNVDARGQARGTLEQTTALLEEHRAMLPVLLAQQADYEAEFYAALVELLGPEGAAAAFAQYERDLQVQFAAEAAARAAANDGGPVLSGNWALPLAGRFTSCFCERWGTMHWGIDIAAPMYTPIYAAGDGVVVQAGAATGFGQAIYVQHDNGDVTVYGHMEVIEVTTGQRVAAGQEIALVGSQGFSTGPHLHFEVYVGGLDGVRVDPVLWLASRGIFV